MDGTTIERLRKTQLFVCDMDGTVYLGNTPIQGATEFVDCLRAKNKKLIFFTNNASRTKDHYKQKLLHLGFGNCEVMTAGDVTINYLKTHYAGKTVFLVGTDALARDMELAGISLVTNSKADIVVSSFDTELTYQKLRTACDALHNGALYLCTHPDLNCPIEGGGWLPDSGAIAAMISAATNKTPKILGKPYAETANAIEQLTGVPISLAASIGDRLYTDIALAKNSGMLSLLVLSGETKENDITEANKPDLVFNSVTEICQYL